MSYDIDTPFEFMTMRNVTIVWRCSVCVCDAPPSAAEKVFAIRFIHKFSEQKVRLARSWACSMWRYRSLVFGDTRLTRTRGHGQPSYCTLYYYFIALLFLSTDHAIPIHLHFPEMDALPQSPATLYAWWDGAADCLAASLNILNIANDAWLFAKWIVTVRYKLRNAAAADADNFLIKI